MHVFGGLDQTAQGRGDLLEEPTHSEQAVHCGDKAGGEYYDGDLPARLKKEGCGSGQGGYEGGQEQDESNIRGKPPGEAGGPRKQAPAETVEEDRRVGWRLRHDNSREVLYRGWGGKGDLAIGNRGNENAKPLFSGWKRRNGWDLAIGNRGNGNMKAVFGGWESEAGFGDWKSQQREREAALQRLEEKK
jgi:hypothetical protein